MARLAQVTGPQLIRVLEKVGFVVTRQRGSHVQVRRLEPDGRVTTFPVPVHSGKTLKKGTLNGILRRAVDGSRYFDRAPLIGERRAVPVRGFPSLRSKKPVVQPR